MPSVPRAEGPQVRDRALPGVYQTAPDTGAPLRAASAAVGAIADGADKLVKRDAEAAANAADQAITANWLQWSAENSKNFQGENAAGYAPAATKWWDDARKEYGDKLDPLAKQFVTQQVGRKQVVAMGQVYAHAEAEKEKHADNTAAANISTTIQFGVTSGDVAGAAAGVRKIASEVGARKGWDTKQVQAEIGKNLSMLHLSYIAKTADANPAAASAYYQQHKDEIGFAQQAKVEEVLKAETDNTFATQFAAAVAQMPLADQLAKAAEIKDPKQREKSILNIRTNHALVREAQQEVERKLSDQAWQLVGQGKKVPESVLAGMDGKERVQLQEHVIDRAKRLAAEGNKPIKTDPAEHVRLIDMMLNDQEGFKTYRLAKSGLKLSASDLEQFAAKQQIMRAGGDKQDGMLTDEARMSDGVLRAGVDAKKDPEHANRIRAEIDRRVRASSADKGGKPLTPDEKQKIVDAVAMDKVFVDEWGRDPQRPLALLSPEEQDSAYVVVNGKDVPLYTTKIIDGKQKRVPTVPTADRVEIITGRRTRGLPVTEQAIVETYLAGQARATATPRSGVPR